MSDGDEIFMLMAGAMFALATPIILVGLFLGVL